MKSQFDNLVTSSMVLFLDHKICSEGEGFTNYSGLIYSINNNYFSYETYALPFKQIIADSSISGANIMSGVYINNNFTTVGNNGLVGINHYRGQTYFTGVVNGTLNGNYAIKDFNIYLTNKSEEEILFKTQFEIRPKTAQSITGLADNTETIPCIFIKNNGGENEPFAFGGVDNTRVDIRCIVLADNLYNLDAVCSILRDSAHEFVYTIKSNELGLDNLGNFTSGYYNYNNLINSKLNTTDKLYIEEVRVSKIPNLGSNTIVYNNSLFSAFVDFTLRKIR
jgi:hypothetical protein